MGGRDGEGVFFHIGGSNTHYGLTLLYLKKRKQTDESWTVLFVYENFI